jgi:hypothetical protein
VVAETKSSTLIGYLNDDIDNGDYIGSEDYIDVNDKKINSK